MSDSHYLGTRDDLGGEDSRKCIILSSLLASGIVFLHITRLSPEPENIRYPMATSKVACIIRLLGNGNSVDVKGTN